MIAIAGGVLPTAIFVSTTGHHREQPLAVEAPHRVGRAPCCRAPHRPIGRAPWATITAPTVLPMLVHHRSDHPVIITPNH